MRKMDLVIGIAILVTIASTSITMMFSEEASAYIPHAPISIDGNGDFIPANGVTGGTGTPTDPFIIEGWEIDAQGGPYCLKIHNTDAHFVLRDSYLQYPEPMSATCVQFQNVSNGKIHNSTVWNHGVGIVIAYSDNITIQDSNVSGAWHDGIVTISSTRIDILNNTLSNRFRGIAFATSMNVNVSGNKASGGSVGIDLWSTDHANITENVVSHSIGIFLQASNNSVVSNNSVSADVSGIRIEGSHSNVVRNNTVTSIASFGIDLIHSNGNIVVDNAIFDSQDGLRVDFSDNNFFLNNTLVSNRAGIYFWVSNGNLMSNNTVLSSENGFEVYDSSSNTIVNNTVASSSVRGITLARSNDCLVYHNNISDNAIQANDSRDTNQWDAGYPLGGNYWSDYVGEDLFSGPNQDLAGSDGIGDTPYVIDADSQDRYPLMDPLGTAPHERFDLLSAVLSGQNAENVTLVWSPSPDDGKGNMSIVGYEVYRGTTYDPGGAGYALIASLVNGTSTFVDSLAGEGDPGNYFYRICSLDSGGNRLFAETQGGKFTRQLSAGIELVSIPLVQSDSSISTVLQTVGFDKAWSYNAWDVADPWKSYVYFKPYKGNLETINHKMGVWVNVTEESNLTVAGIVPFATSIQFHTGWNLVGFPSFGSSYSVSDLKAEAGATRVEGLDSLTPPYYLRPMNDGELLQAGFGYWVYLESDAVWSVQNL